jgi:putative hydrolase of the HAD superfamily
MIKAILFDIDNTLIDFMKMKHKSCEAAVDAMVDAGLKLPGEQVSKVLYELYDKYGIEYQKIFQKLTKELTGKIDYKIIAHGVIAYRKMRESYLTPYANVMSTLIELKKSYKLAVVSDAPVMEAWMRLVSMNLDTFFDVVITKANARKQKTHAAPFRAALRELGLKPEEAIMTGDRISRDIDTAKKLGLHTAYARYGDPKPVAPGKSGAEFELSDVSELISIAKNIR